MSAVSGSTLRFDLVTFWESRAPADPSMCSGCETDVVSDRVDEYLLLGERRVGYCVYHRGAHRRAVFQYGTPGTRWLSPQLVGAAEAAGFELLVIDRPGYGGAVAGRAGVSWTSLRMCAQCWMRWVGIGSRFGAARAERRMRWR
jgi:hypothetical protein